MGQLNTRVIIIVLHDLTRDFAEAVRKMPDLCIIGPDLQRGEIPRDLGSHPIKIIDIPHRRDTIQEMLALLPPENFCKMLAEGWPEKAPGVAAVYNQRVTADMPYKGKVHVAQTLRDGSPVRASLVRHH